MTNGIEGVMFLTHNWGKSAAFWQGLGFELEFDTGHNSGQLRHPSGGPYVFLAEMPADQPLDLQPALVLNVPNHQEFEPPRAGKVERPFEAQHWNVMEMLVLDPDGRRVSIQAPLPAAEAAE